MIYNPETDIYDMSPELFEVLHNKWLCLVDKLKLDDKKESEIFEFFSIVFRAGIIRGIKDPVVNP